MGKSGKILIYKAFVAKYNVVIKTMYHKLE